MLHKQLEEKTILFWNSWKMVYSFCLLKEDDGEDDDGTAGAVSIKQV